MSWCNCSLFQLCLTSSGKPMRNGCPSKSKSIVGLFHLIIGAVWSTSQDMATDVVVADQIFQKHLMTCLSMLSQINHLLLFDAVSCVNTDSTFWSYSGPGKNLRSSWSTWHLRVLCRLIIHIRLWQHTRFPAAWLRHCEWYNCAYRFIHLKMQQSSDFRMKRQVNITPCMWE